MKHPKEPQLLAAERLAEGEYRAFPQDVIDFVNEIRFLRRRIEVLTEELVDLRAFERGAYG